MRHFFIFISLYSLYLWLQFCSNVILSNVYCKRTTPFNPLNNLNTLLKVLVMCLLDSVLFSLLMQVMRGNVFLFSYLFDQNVFAFYFPVFNPSKMKQDFAIFLFTIFTTYLRNSCISNAWKLSSWWWNRRLLLYFQKLKLRFRYTDEFLSENHALSKLKLWPR